MSLFLVMVKEIFHTVFWMLSAKSFPAVLFPEKQKKT